MKRAEVLLELEETLPDNIVWPAPIDGDTIADNKAAPRSTFARYVYGEQVISLDTQDSDTASSPLAARMRTRELVVLHFFSGIRRKGDLQAELEWMGTLDGFMIVVISLDIAVSAERCDLRRQQVLFEWMVHVRCGRVVAKMLACLSMSDNPST